MHFKAAADAALRAAQDITAAVQAEFGDEGAGADDFNDTIMNKVRGHFFCLSAVLASFDCHAWYKVLHQGMSAERMLLCKVHTGGNLGLQDDAKFEEACPKKPRRGDVMGALRAGMDKLVAATHGTLQGIGSSEVVQRFWVCLQVCCFAR